MKKLIAAIIGMLCFMMLLQSCSKTKTQQIVLEVPLKANQSYQYNLGSFGDEEGAGISTQANHYLISEVIYDTAGTSQVFYAYKPAINFAGSDEVVLKSAKGSNGSGHNPYITYTVIKFTISN